MKEEVENELVFATQTHTRLHRVCRTINNTWNIQRMVFASLRKFQSGAPVLGITRVIPGCRER